MEERKRAKSLADDKKILVMGGDFHKMSEGGGYYTNEVWSSTGAIWKTVNSTITKTMFGIVMLKYQKLHSPPNLPQKPQSSCLHMPRTRKDVYFSTGCSSSLKMI